jgi:gamma-glutamyl hercynylcysteine S-oxide synthase
MKELAAQLLDARERTLELTSDLSEEQLLGPRLRIVNPPRWEIGHVAWFQERWVLRHARGLPPLRQDGDALYDSSAVPHSTRWGLPLPSPAETRAYLQEVRDRVLEGLAGASALERYFVQLSLFHEDMHVEALAYTRQTHGYSPPAVSLPTSGEGGDAGPLPGDVPIPGGRFWLGARSTALGALPLHPGGAPPGPEIEGLPDEPFLFDNERWAHPVEVRPFAIARAAVTQAELCAFVEAGGYQRPALWSEAGWRWRTEAGAEHPVYWRKDGGRWLRRHFDRWVELEPHRPALHVCWYEAEAFCRFAGRRLPTELEWEVAAAGGPDGQGGLSPRKRRYPWGDEPPSPTRANLDFSRPGCLDVGALPEGDSAFGCRQMLGNTWEWTTTDFAPYPGFVADPYQEYSAPWFQTHKVLRGGCYATRGRLIRNTWRNFYTPERRDVWAGFRTCAL